MAGSDFDEAAQWPFPRMRTNETAKT